MTVFNIRPGDSNRSFTFGTGGVLKNNKSIQIPIKAGKPSYDYNKYVNICGDGNIDDDDRNVTDPDPSGDENCDAWDYDWSRGSDGVWCLDILNAPSGPYKVTIGNDFIGNIFEEDIDSEDLSTLNGYFLSDAFIRSGGSVCFDKKSWAIDNSFYVNHHNIHGTNNPINIGVTETLFLRIESELCPDLVFQEEMCIDGGFSYENSALTSDTEIQNSGTFSSLFPVGQIIEFSDTQIPTGGPFPPGATFGEAVAGSSYPDCSSNYYSALAIPALGDVPASSIEFTCNNESFVESPDGDSLSSQFTQLFGTTGFTTDGTECVEKVGSWILSEGGNCCVPQGNIKVNYPNGSYFIIKPALLDVY